MGVTWVIRLLVLFSFVCEGVVVKYKLRRYIESEECLETAGDLGLRVGLEDVRRVFKTSGKHEARHEQSELHLWYQGTAEDADAAETAVELLRSYKDRVERANVNSLVTPPKNDDTTFRIRTQ